MPTESKNGNKQVIDNGMERVDSSEFNEDMAEHFEAAASPYMNDAQNFSTNFAEQVKNKKQQES